MYAASSLLQDYLAAISAKNIDAIDKMSNAHCLIEIPFLKPNRLLGKAEILKAHREIFSNLETIDFSLTSTEFNTSHAIAEGRLEFIRTGTGKQSFQAGIVAEATGDELRRVSLYCDARNVRLWSDRTIL